MVGPNMPRLIQITPFVMVSDMAKSLAFYTDVLGFSCTFQAANYAFVRRDAAALRLLEAEPDCNLHDPLRQQHCYIDVDDVDALYLELRPALDSLPAARVRALFDTYYGQREFHVIDLDALLISFGMTIKQKA